MTYHMPTIWWMSNQIMWEKTVPKKFEISHVVCNSQKYQIYNVFSYQYKYETFNGKMSVHNVFFGTCHFCISEWLEYILGKMTWNKIWGPFLLQEKVWQCWYVVKAAVLIMRSLGWPFQKHSCIRSAHHTTRSQSICLTCCWRFHTYRNGHNRCDKSLKQYHTFIYTWKISIYASQDNSLKTAIYPRNMSYQE